MLSAFLNAKLTAYRVTKNTIAVCVLGLLAGLTVIFNQPAISAPPAKALKATPSKLAKTAVVATTVTPLALVKEPATYLNQTVTFEAEFRGFSSVGLDYKPAFRDAKDYVTLLVRRPDVTHHTIPLSELKLFYPRKEAEMLSKLEPGDKVRFQGNVFSIALGDPWMDVSTFTIQEAVKRKTEDEEPTTSSPLEGQD